MANVKTTVVQTNNTALSGNATPWKAPLATSYGFFAIAVNEATIQRPSGVYSNLRTRVVTNTNNNTTIVRVNNNGSAGNNSVSIATTLTGSFEDISHTDTVTAGNNTWLECLVVSGSTGSITFALTQIDFIANSDTHTTLSSHGTAALATASTTNYHHLTATLSNTITVESQVQTHFRSSWTLKNFRIRITTDNRGANTTYRIRKNAVNGNQSVATTNTGEFEDTTNTDTIVSNDKICVSSTTGTGTGTQSFSAAAIDVENTTNAGFPIVNTGGATQNFGTTRFESGGIGLAFTTETSTQIKLYKAATLKNLTANISANTVNGTTTIRMRNNAANANPVVTVGASTTGFFTDDASTTVTADGDLVNFSIVTAGTSGSINYRTLYVEVYPNTPVTKQLTIRNNISQEVTKQLTTKFSILSELTKQLTTRFSILSEVTKQLTTKVSILNEVTKQLTTRFDILESLTAITKDLTLKFSINQEVTKQLTTKFSILSELTKQLTTKFSILQAITKQLTTKFSINQELTKQLTTKFSILNSLTKQLTTKFSILNEVTKQLIAKVSILSELTKQLTTKFSILETVTATKTHKWNTAGTVSTSKTHKYSIVTKVTKSKTHKYNVLISIARTHTHKYHVIARVSTTRTHKYNVIEKLIVSKTHLYNLAGKVTRTHTHKFNVTGATTQVSTTKIHVYDIVTKISVTKTHKWNIKSVVSVTKTHKWHIIARIIVTKTHKYNIKVKVTSTRTHKYHVAIKVTKTRTHSYNILTKITKSKTHKYNIIAKVTRTHTHKWNEGGRVRLTKIHKYDVGEGRAIIEGAGSINVLIKFPERVRVIDIISDIRNLALANIEILDSQLKPQNIAIGVVELATNDARVPLALRTASRRYNIRVASRLIVPEIQTHIEHKAVSGRIAIEVLPLSKEAQLQVRSLLQLETKQYPSIYLASSTQLRQTKHTKINLASSTQIATKQRIASVSNVQIPYNLSRQIIRVSEIMTREWEQTARALIDLLKNDDLFQ